jgi:hypothetical protein
MGRVILPSNVPPSIDTKGYQIYYEEALWDIYAPELVIYTSRYVKEVDKYGKPIRREIIEFDKFGMKHPIARIFRTTEISLMQPPPLKKDHMRVGYRMWYHHNYRPTQSQLLQRYADLTDLFIPFEDDPVKFEEYFMETASKIFQAYKNGWISESLKKSNLGMECLPDQINELEQFINEHQRMKDVNGHHRMKNAKP